MVMQLTCFSFFYIKFELICHPVNENLCEIILLCRMIGKSKSPKVTPAFLQIGSDINIIINK